MVTESALLPRLLQMQKSMLSSLRLKDVLEHAAAALEELTGGKVALFLSDNESLSLKLMSSRGYQNACLEILRILPFSAETILKVVVQKRTPLLVQSASQAPDISASIMQRENSRAQIGLPLLASNLLVGAILIDVSDDTYAPVVDILPQVAGLIALSLQNAILYGRSEYERQRLETLYKTSMALTSNSLKADDVMRIAADTALVLGGTPHCAVLLFDQQKQNFHVAAFKGLDGNSLRDFNLALEGTIAGRALNGGKSVYLADSLAHQQELPRDGRGNPFASVAAVPLRCGNDPLGVIMLFSPDLRAFHREQVELLESLAQQTSGALFVALTHESATAQSIQDAHTGLYNRWHFDDVLHKELERSQRHKRDLALALIDIDHLSRVNDLLGQEKGDEVIKHVARVIKNALRDIDIPCRFGEEEFVVVLPDTGMKSATEVAERLRQTIRKEAAPGIGLVTVSIGVACASQTDRSSVGLIKRAEEALDVAKFEGRDRVKVHQSLAYSNGDVPWDELARQAKLAVIGERQARLQNRLQAPPEYAPWMRALPTWGKKKRDVERPQ